MAGTGNTALIVGASRGLGRAVAAEFASRGWSVIGTVRDAAATVQGGVHGQSGGVRTETLDMREADDIARLRSRLDGRTLDVLFVCAGITTHDPLALVGEVRDDEFGEVMLTNALAPMRVIDALQDLVPASGLIGVMSSGQGSITQNEKGTREVYRASKAALNMLVRSFAARKAQASRAIVLIAPGWIRTDLGGPDAPFSVEEAVPMLVDVLIDKRDRPGLEYLDRFGASVPW